MNRLAALLRLCVGLIAALALTGCHFDMWRQNKVHKPYQESDFFADGRATRPPLAGTVAQKQLREDDHLYVGVAGGRLADTFPFPVTEAVLRRGQERFNVFCAPCHSKVGDGNGMIAQRGLALRRQPANYHTERLRQSPPGHFYDVITNGYGAMYSYASRIEPEDRWAIVAYIRALQFSQDARLADVPPAERERLLTGGAAGQVGQVGNGR